MNSKFQSPHPQTPQQKNSVFNYTDLKDSTRSLVQWYNVCLQNRQLKTFQAGYSPKNFSAASSTFSPYSTDYFARKITSFKEKNFENTLKFHRSLKRVFPQVYNTMLINWVIFKKYSKCLTPSVYSFPVIPIL